MENLIQWTSQEVDFPEIDIKLLEEWLGEVAASHNRIMGPLTYIFCSDNKILEVNRQFLNHDYFTDIITFDNTHGKRISGDLFISLETVASNAELVGASYETELHRVIAHGLLHLCGINDKAPGEREIMEKHEDQALTLLNSIKSR
ncbi:MAG: rRNA maturation RNase YbeY [Paramuribaculum sp.]|nr:rRNA maturation RNase YbeY [Paramuribaculum sp.]MDE6489271.1 rRNA maturation RNase YbeY [Paramuribaculum sp.]